MKEKVIKLLSTGFFTGYIPYAPGTFGTLLGIPVLYLLKKIPLYFSLAFILGFSIFSVFLAGHAKKIYNSSDPKCVVIDEIVGYLYASIFFPFNLKFLVLSFLFFRFFDILKPYPIKKSELLNKGWGIVLDDIISGVFSAFVLFIMSVILKF